MRIYSVSLAGISLPCVLTFPEVADKLSALPLNACVQSMQPVQIPPEHWSYYAGERLYCTVDGELRLMCCYCSEALLAFDRMLFHSVALRWRDKAYLIAAPSGVGKSTQAMHLQALRPGEFSIISGDHPVLQFCPSSISGDGALPASAYSSVLVHPSYWNGKEGWHGASAAPLAGLILLQRGEENRIVPMKPREAAIQAYSQAVQTNLREDVVHRVALMVEQMLKLVPIWQLTTFQVPDSTELLLRTVFSNLDAEKGRLRE